MHPIADWDELKQRLGSRRRVFVLTHPAVQPTPLVLLQVAITPTVAGSIGAPPTSPFC